MALHVLLVVEIDEHGGVLADAHQQIAKVAVRVFAEHGELAEHLAIVDDLVISGGEVAVPEQHQFLLERAAGFEHTVGEPGLGAPHFQTVDVAVVVERIDHGLLVGLGQPLHLWSDAGANRVQQESAAVGRQLVEPAAGNRERR